MRAQSRRDNRRKSDWLSYGGFDVSMGLEVSDPGNECSIRNKRNSLVPLENSIGEIIWRCRGGRAIRWNEDVGYGKIKK